MLAVIGAPDETWIGRRGHVLFLMMYSTGARVSEITWIKIGDVTLQIVTPASICTARTASSAASRGGEKKIGPASLRGPFTSERSDSMRTHQVLGEERHKDSAPSPYVQRSINLLIIPSRADSPAPATCAPAGRPPSQGRPSPAVSNLCSSTPTPRQQSASRPSIATAGTVRTPRARARCATAVSCISSTSTSHDCPASFWTSETTSLQHEQPALNT